LPPQFTLEVIIPQISFQGFPCHIATAVWIQDVEVTVYLFIFAPDYTTAQRGTAAVPCRLGNGNA
jgi:hypothetical protein